MPMCVHRIISSECSKINELAGGGGPPERPLRELLLLAAPRPGGAPHSAQQVRRYRRIAAEGMGCARVGGSQAVLGKTVFDMINYARRLPSNHLQLRSPAGLGELGGDEVGGGGVEDPEVLIEAGDRRGLVALGHVGRHRLPAARPGGEVPARPHSVEQPISRAAAFRACRASQLGRATGAGRASLRSTAAQSTSGCSPSSCTSGSGAATNQACALTWRAVGGARHTQYSQRRAHAARARRLTSFGPYFPRRVAGSVRMRPRRKSSIGLETGGRSCGTTMGGGAAISVSSAR